MTNNFNESKYGEPNDLNTEIIAKEQFEKIRINSAEGLKIAQRRIIAVFAIVLCMAFILGIFSIAANSKATKDLDYLYNDPLMVRSYAYQLNIHVLQTYIAMNDLAIGNAEDRDRIRQCVNRANENMSKANQIFAILRSLAPGDGILRPSFDELGALLEGWEPIREQSLGFALDGNMEEYRKNVDYYDDAQVKKINECLDKIVNDAAALAAESHDKILSDSKQYDVYAIILTAVILLCGLIVLMYVKKHTSGAADMIDSAQREQAEILDELAIMDETLRQSLSEIEDKSKAMEHMAYYDSVTGLPNRVFFADRLKEALYRSRENRTSGCVLMIDIDNFKIINDSHGHDFGDMLLEHLSRRLQDTLGGETMVARFGGDEFLILLEDILGEDYVQAYILRIIDALGKPILIEDISCHITASIGVSIFPEDGKDVNILLRNADSARYEGKNAGHSTFTFYSKDMSDKVMRKSAIGNILHNAIENGAVYTVYQPQYSPALGRVVGFETLMRVREDKLGSISPAEFIPIAEETRLIIPLGYWAIRRAIETDIMLREQGLDFDYISVNISEVQLQSVDFVENIRKIIEEYKFEAARLHMEVTESILLKDLGQKEIDVFDELHRMGVKIELDDFGTGYSSLNYVRMIPLDVLKIDKCFIDEIGVNEEKEGLIDLIIRLARTFEADVVAEGVETAEQVEFLKRKGDVIIQGYYYSRPLDAKALPEKVNELNRADVGETEEGEETFELGGWDWQ